MKFESDSGNYAGIVIHLHMLFCQRAPMYDSEEFFRILLLSIR